ncbi:hypothetical protein C8F01DRAFT_1076783 [Mycena amicta]|nr:hypothetical protein C8F01DRAFT_1076783 [Mycena amicta]
MHPCLDVSNLLELQEPLRLSWLQKTAIAAANGDLDELSTILGLIEDEEMEWSDYALRGISPALYCAIDPAEIPSLRRFDTLDPVLVENAIRRVVYVFRCLESLMWNEVLPVGAFIDVWRRVWSWIEFLDEFHTNLPFPVMYDSELAKPVDQAYSICMNLLDRVWERIERHPAGEDSELRRMVSDAYAPRILVVVGRAWSRLLRVKDDLGLYHVSMIILMDRIGEQTSPTRLAELCVGAGGTWSALARLVVGHLRRASVGRGAKKPISLDDAQMIHSMATLLFRLPHQTNFREALYDEGISAALTTALGALVRSPILPEFHFLPHQIFNWLAITFRGGNFQHGVAQALRAGFLRAMLEYASIGTRTRQNLALVLQRDLRRATVYHSVLVHLPRALSRVRRVDYAASLGSPELVGHWRDFCSLAQERLDILEVYRTRALTATRGCDNVQCGQVVEKSLLQRCSGCLAAHYCSRACQKTDWKRGSHRRKCASLKTKHQHNLQHALPRDWSFIRGLLNSRYYALRESIALSSLRLFYNARGSRPILDPWPLLAVWFDLNKVPGQIKVKVELPFDVAYSEDFKDEIGRVSRSRGRLRMHLLVMPCPASAPEENIACLRYMPLKCENSRMEDGIRQILDGIPPRVGNQELNVELYRTRIQALIGELGVETH